MRKSTTNQLKTILQAAREQLLTKRFYEISINELIRKTGMRPGTFFNHSSKDIILSHIHTASKSRVDAIYKDGSTITLTRGNDRVDTHNILNALKDPKVATLVRVTEYREILKAPEVNGDELYMQ